MLFISLRGLLAEIGTVNIDARPKLALHKFFILNLLGTGLA